MEDSPFPLHFVGPPEYKAELDRAERAIANVVSFGSHVIKWSMTRQAGLLKNHESAAIQLFRHQIEMFDAAACLAGAGCGEAMKPIIRSGIEALWGEEYVLDSDFQRRGMAYHVGHAHDRLQWLERLDATTQAGNTLRTEIEASHVKRAREWSFRLPAADTSALRNRLLASLAGPDCADVEVEWQRTASGRSPSQVKWYSLFGGPRNARTLAYELGQGEEYELLYRDFSSVVHAESAAKAVSFGDDGDLTLEGFRNPGDLWMLVSLCLMQGLRGCRVTVQKVVPERSGEVGRWYAARGRAEYVHFEQLGRSAIGAEPS